MKVFFVRQLCGMVGLLILYFYFVCVLQTRIGQVESVCLVATLVVLPGLVHVIRLQHVPMVRFEVVTCGIEAILMSIIAIVCLSLLPLFGSLNIFILGLVILVVAVLIYPSHVLRWDYDHGLK